MNKISEIWERTIGIEGVDTGYPKFEKEVEDFIQETINSLLDELEIEKASIPCNQRGIGFNDAVDEFNSKLERFRG